MTEYCKYCGEFFRRVSSHIGYCRERISKEASEKAELKCELRLLKEKLQKDEEKQHIVYNITNNITITNINVATSLRDTFDTFLEEMKEVIKNEEQENIINIAKSHPNPKVRNAIDCLIKFDMPFKEIDTPNILYLKEKIDHNSLDKIETMYDAIKKDTVSKMNQIAGRLQT